MLWKPHLGVSLNEGYLFGGPYSKDRSILGSILGSPYLGKLPFASLSRLQVGLKVKGSGINVWSLVSILNRDLLNFFLVSLHPQGLQVHPQMCSKNLI